MFGRTPICDFACFRSLAKVSLAAATPSGPTSTAFFSAAAPLDAQLRLVVGDEELPRLLPLLLLAALEGLAAAGFASSAEPGAERTASNAAKTTAPRNQRDHAMAILPYSLIQQRVGPAFQRDSPRTA